MDACLTDLVYCFQIVGGETGERFCDAMPTELDCKSEGCMPGGGGAKVSCNVNRMREAY